MPKETLVRKWVKWNNSLKEIINKLETASVNLGQVLLLAKYNKLITNFESASGNMTVAEKELDQFLDENYNGELKDETNAISEAEKALEEFKMSHGNEIKQAQEKIENLQKEEEKAQQEIGSFKHDNLHETERLEGELEKVKADSLVAKAYLDQRKKKLLAETKYLNEEGSEIKLECELSAEYDKLTKNVSSAFLDGAKAKAEEELSEFIKSYVEKALKEFKMSHENEIKQVQEKIENLQKEEEKVQQEIVGIKDDNLKETKRLECELEKAKTTFTIAAKTYFNKKNYLIEEGSENKLADEVLAKYDQLTTNVSSASEDMAKAKAKAEEELYKFFCKNYNCEADEELYEFFRKNDNCEADEELYQLMHENNTVELKDEAEKALEEVKMSHVKKIKQAQEKLETLNEEKMKAQQEIESLTNDNLHETRRLEGELEEVKTDTSAAKTYFDQWKKMLLATVKIKQAQEKIENLNKAKESAQQEIKSLTHDNLNETQRLEGELEKAKAAFNLAAKTDYSKKYDKLINELTENHGGLNGSFVDLNELQLLEKEMNSLLSAKGKGDASESKEEPAKLTFSARVESGLTTAMNFLKKHQKTIRNTAGSLFAVGFIYNIAAIIAGFNAFALMASIATLTGTLPLVLASVEITLIAFAGTSLVAYTATNNRVREAFSLEPIAAEKSEANKSSTGANGSAPSQKL